MRANRSSARGPRPRPAGFFASAPTIQAKLTVGAAGDRFEREADSVADAVVQRKPARATERGSAPAVQAKCATCEHEEMVQREADGSAPGSGDFAADSVQQGIAARSGAGQALATPVRLEMEEGIGADFSGVRIHTDAPAASLNEQLHARAFTHGQDVFFSPGQFDPASSGGKHLLAHELTHVVQQSGSQAPGVQRDTAGGGSTDFTDTVTSTPATGTSPVIRGRVTRTETAPAHGSQPSEVIHTGHMNVEFDPTTCEVTIPFGYRFVQAPPAQAGPCDAGPNHTLLSPTEFAAVKANVLRVLNAGLNGWFDVRITGSACPTGCSDRLIPIRVVVSENDASPDTTITVVNRAGRANAATICAQSWSDSTAVHEGGHQVLGVGDEYPEHDEAFRATAPEWFRTERVRRDYSMMGPEEHTRFAMFQERHFAAVTAFMRSIYPGCNATLVARSRPVIPDFRITFSAGYAPLSGMPGYYFRTGIDMGIPLDRLRSWELTLGPEFTYLTASAGLANMRALLFGARIGLEGSTGAGGWGVMGGPFIAGGAGLFSSRNPAVPGGEREAWMPYGEVGARFGLRTEMFGGGRFNFGLEGAAGSTIGAPGIVGPAGPEVASDPERAHWFRVGLGLEAMF